MGKMTAEQWVEKLREYMGDNLKSVVLFGSAASGEKIGPLSDMNLLVVAGRLGSEQLQAISEAATPWLKQGNAPPVFLTEGELSGSADVFPIEFSDLQDVRKVLFGTDPFLGLVFSKANLRAELEHEFRGSLWRLRRTLLATEMDRRKVGELMLKSVSTFLVLFRTAIRLKGENPPLKKMEAIAILRKHVDFDDEVFRILDESRHNGADPRDVAAFLDRYLSALDALVVWIDQENNAA
jgi:hypothetical protein